MDLLDFGHHLLGFLAPACFVGWLLALGGLLFASASSSNGVGDSRLRRCWRAGWLNTLAACLASTAVLVLSGRDGEMAGYAALVLAAASSQWLMQRGWRR